MAELLLLDEHSFPGLCMARLANGCGIAYIDLSCIVEVGLENQIASHRDDSLWLHYEVTGTIYRVVLQTEPARTSLIVDSESFERIYNAWQQYKRENG